MLKCISIFEQFVRTGCMFVPGWYIVQIFMFYLDSSSQLLPIRKAWLFYRMHQILQYECDQHCYFMHIHGQA
jgi:hypothetical protein